MKAEKRPWALLASAAMIMTAVIVYLTDSDRGASTSQTTNPAVSVPLLPLNTLLSNTLTPLAPLQFSPPATQAESIEIMGWITQENKPSWMDSLGVPYPDFQMTSWHGLMINFPSQTNLTKDDPK
jgi:hypothetical protein